MVYALHMNSRYVLCKDSQIDEYLAKGATIMEDDRIVATPEDGFVSERPILQTVIPISFIREVINDDAN